VWTERRISYVEPSGTPIKFEIQFLSLSPRINLYRILSTILKIIYSLFQKSCLLLFSWAEQSFSSCHSRNAVTSAQFTLDGLSVTSPLLHQSALSHTSTGTFSTHKIILRFHTGTLPSGPSWPVLGRTFTFTFTFTQIPSSSTPYSLNCTTHLNLAPVLSALVQ